MLTLYYAPGTVALATHIALEDAKADYSAKRLDFAKQEQRSPAYLAVNPKGRVPALVTERGVLTETPAMLVYVAQLFPAARLAPFDDAFAFGEMQAFNAYLCSTVHVAHAHRMRGHRWADEETSFADMKRKVPQTMFDACALIEGSLLRGPWVMGEQYSVADPYLFTLTRWLEGDGVDPKRLPRMLAHRERMEQRASVQTVLGEHRA